VIYFAIKTNRAALPKQKLNGLQTKCKTHLKYLLFLAMTGSYNSLPVQKKGCWVILSRSVFSIPSQIHPALR
jgi:hypothetical protein